MVPTLRTATLEDAALIAQLTRECWVGKPADSSGHTESAESVTQTLREGTALILYLYAKPVGSVRWYPVINTQNGEVIAWEVGRLGILPAYRGRGLGLLVMQEITARAITSGIEELRLAVRTDEPSLQEFYRRQGFVEDASIVYSHANPNSPKPVTMRKYLLGLHQS
jgi:ribosomal protein S18 acetylase RimI-like enzyme